jgi:hypothetical protein
MKHVRCNPPAPALLCAAGVLPAQAQEIVRHKIPGSDFPIAQAVTLPPNATIHFISGQVPPVIDKAAARIRWPPSATPKSRPWACSRRSRKSSKAWAPWATW